MSLTTGLVSYYKLDGNSNDSVASNNGTDTAITYSTANGIINQGAGFNGTTSNIAFSTAPFTANSAFSISFWFKAVSVTGLPGAVTIGLLGNQLGCGFDATHLYLADFGTSDYQAATTISTGQWYYGVWVYNGGWNPGSDLTAVTFYLNGSKITTSLSEGSSNPFPLTNSMLFGQRSGTTFYNGDVDEVGFWSRVLTSSEVTQLYNGGAGLQYPFTTSTQGSMLSFFGR